MGVMYSKQPNGLYCRFSSIVDTITHYNLNEHDLAEMLGKFDADRLINSSTNTDYRYFHLWPFDYVKKLIRPDNETVNNIRAELKEMGDKDWETFEYETW